MATWPSFPLLFVEVLCWINAHTRHDAVGVKALEELKQFAGNPAYAKAWLLVHFSKSLGSVCESLAALMQMYLS